ncbi:hypothetical protein MJ585_22690 [Klebsiella pneumoniae]|nr:hypothetical protein MJ585_22690 [Klebsiella pneumoniae]
MNRRCGVVYAPSQHFASEPKVGHLLVLRNPQAMDSARRQVMFALNDYLAGIAPTSPKPGGGRRYLPSTGANNGLMVIANGYTPASSGAVQRSRCRDTQPYADRGAAGAGQILGMRR